MNELQLYKPCGLLQ